MDHGCLTKDKSSSRDPLLQGGAGAVCSFSPPVASRSWLGAAAPGLGSSSHGRRQGTGGSQPERRRWRRAARRAAFGGRASGGRPVGGDTHRRAMCGGRASGGACSLIASRGISVPGPRVDKNGRAVARPVRAAEEVATGEAKAAQPKPAGGGGASPLCSRVQAAPCG